MCLMNVEGGKGHDGSMYGLTSVITAVMRQEQVQERQQQLLALSHSQSQGKKKRSGGAEKKQTDIVKQEREIS